MILHAYKCQDCGEVTDAFDDEPIPVCHCGRVMRKRLSAGGAPGTTYKIFREYRIDNNRVISSKAEEQRMLASMSAEHRTDAKDQLRVEVVNKHKRKQEIEELRHKVLKQLGPTNPKIAKTIENRPIPDIDTL